MAKTPLVTMKDAQITDDATIAELCARLELDEPLSKEFIRVSLENAKLFNRKQKDYGPRNISDFGTFGCVLRINDKVNRLKTLLGTKRRKPRNESVEDSFRDNANYSIIALMVERGIWPK